MLVGNFKASWNHKTQEGKITLTGINPPTINPVTQVIEGVNASEMSALLAILKVNEPVEYNTQTGVLSMRNAKVITVNAQ